MTCNKECSVCRRCKLVYEEHNPKHQVISLSDDIMKSLKNSHTPFTIGTQ